MLKNKPTKKIIIGALIVLLAGILITFLYVFINGYPAFFSKADKVTLTTREDIINRVNSLVDLPIQENPSEIISVTDLKNLTASNPFSAVAESNDLILIYKQNKLAVLFRPTSGKIVSMGKLDQRKTQVEGATTEGVSATPSASAIPESSKVPTPVPLAQ